MKVPRLGQVEFRLYEPVHYCTMWRLQRPSVTFTHGTERQPLKTLAEATKRPGDA
jgi:hypothetical protein